jgi:hypothetical protein
VPILIAPTVVGAAVALSLGAGVLAWLLGRTG